MNILTARVAVDVAGVGDSTQQKEVPE